MCWCHIAESTPMADDAFLKYWSRLEAEVHFVEVGYSGHFPRRCFSEIERSEARAMLRRLGYSEVRDAMSEACTRIARADHVMRAFYKICWHRLDARGSLA